MNSDQGTLDNVKKFTAVGTDEIPVARPPLVKKDFRAESRAKGAKISRELMVLARAMAKSKGKRRILILVAGVVAILLVNMFGQVQLNAWQGEFYRAIEKRSLDLVWRELAIFVGLIAILLSVVVSQTWLVERLKIRLRECLSHRLLDEWLSPGRAYRLGISSDEAVNPDQRIQEDVRNFSEMSAELGVGILQATLLLISFIGVLWAMSNLVEFTIHGERVKLPGYMVWVAITYAVLGSWLTARVGNPLISLNEERYTEEANLRFSLVRLNESSESVSFYSGEKDERSIVNKNFSRVFKLMGKMSFAHARLTWVTSGYGWLVIVIPVMVALPGYLQGTIDLGGLMMVVGAFTQVQGSLRWFVDNFARIADWRAALHRVHVFFEAVTGVDDVSKNTVSIERVLHPEGKLSFERVKVSLIDGEVVIADATAEINPGERVLIVGESGSGKSTLLRAVSGLWPWGSGVIRVPRQEEMMFLPQRPYMPLGTLREALAYPGRVEEFDAEAMKACLLRVNLADFVEMLDMEERWDKLMSLGQQQRFAFARVLLHRPKWVFCDEATSALDDENQDCVMSLFNPEGDLADSALLSIGHRPGLSDYHTRTLRLISSANGMVLEKDSGAREKTEPKFWQKLFASSDNAKKRMAAAQAPTTALEGI